MPGYEPGDLGLLSTLRSLKMEPPIGLAPMLIALYSAPVATEGTVAKVVRLEGFAPSRTNGTSF